MPPDTFGAGQPAAQAASVAQANIA
jgi:hypothetical protein